MSVVVYKALVCECEAKHQSVSQCHGESTPDWTLRDARRAAKRDGWRRIHGQDACPGCVDHFVSERGS